MKRKFNINISLEESRPIGSKWMVAPDGSFKKKGIQFYLPKTAGKTDDSRNFVFINRGISASA